MSTLSKKCRESIEETRDSTGTREIYVFLGLTYKIDTNNEGLIFDIPPNTFLEIYKKYVIPKWLDKVANDPVPLPYSNYSVQESKNPFNLDTFDVKETSSGTRKALESNIDSDEQLYKYTLSKVKIGQEVSMCTKLSNLNSFAKSPFESATCLNSSGSLKDILENQQHKEEIKFKTDSPNSRTSPNTDNNSRIYKVNGSFSNHIFLDEKIIKNYDIKVMDENKDYGLKNECSGRNNYTKYSFEEKTDLNRNIENIDIVSKGQSFIRNVRSIAKFHSLDNAKNVVICFIEKSVDNSINLDSSLENICSNCPRRNTPQKVANKNIKEHQIEESESNRTDIFDL